MCACPAQARLEAEYGFECRCHRCVVEAAAIEEEGRDEWGEEEGEEEDADERREQEETVASVLEDNPATAATLTRLAAANAAVSYPRLQRDGCRRCEEGGRWTVEGEAHRIQNKELHKVQNKEFPGGRGSTQNTKQGITRSKVVSSR